MKLTLVCVPTEVENSGSISGETLTYGKKV